MKIMEKYIERMCEESKELSAQVSVINERIDKLEKFMSDSPVFLAMTEKAQIWQKRQCEVMKQCLDALGTYRDIVDKRIAMELSK